MAAACSLGTMRHVRQAIAVRSAPRSSCRFASLEESSFVRTHPGGATSGVVCIEGAHGLDGALVVDGGRVTDSCEDVLVVVVCDWFGDHDALTIAYEGEVGGIGCAVLIETSWGMYIH